ncbi:MAG: class I SAM-dependent methyltransferase [Thermodesulfobacteriota bacterium]
MAAEEEGGKVAGAAEEAYSEYLRGRSLKGFLYRKWLLYPRIIHRLDGRILDFGCGIGDFLACCRNAVGVDSNPHNVAVCLKRGLDATVVRDRRLPFADRHFSGVVMDNVLEHIPGPEVVETMREVLRVLMPGGTLVIGMPGPRGYAADEDHRCFYTEGELIRLMGSFACVRRKIFHAPFYFPPLGRCLRQYCLYVFFQAPPVASPDNVTEEGQKVRIEA